MHGGQFALLDELVELGTSDAEHVGGLGDGEQTGVHFHISGFGIAPVRVNRWTRALAGS